MIKLFKKRSYKGSEAFSLIEILISLIIISLLVAAFTPIITKKLKASDISIGSFGSGSNVNMTLERQVTKEDCDKYDALFIPAAMNGGTRNLCVTKYNMGDNGLPLADSVKKLSVGNTCADKDKGNCCWNGKTAGICGNTGNGDSDYSGCNRTVCQWSAANASCASFAPNDENEGRWRLPNRDEAKNWSGSLLNLNTNKGKGGLQLCDKETSINGAVQCYPNNNQCTTAGFSDTMCRPHRAWTMTPDEDKNYYEYTLDTGKLLDTNAPFETANSVRCVLDSIAVDISELPGGSGIKDPTVDPFYGEPKNQEDCDKIVAIFIDKKMSGANRNICVSKYNVGDAGPDGFGPPIPESYEQYTLNAGQTCTHSGGCCWKGKTASTCGLDGNQGANYSGCNRTVCQYNVANAACRAYNAFGATAVGAWRLPKNSEFSAWAQNGSLLSPNKGEDGLQLCTESVTAGYVQCYFSQSCPGASDSYCLPGRLWSSTETIANTYATLNSAFQAGKEAYNRTGSARCVYDGITKADNFTEDLDDYDDSNAPKDEPKSQADCDKLTAIFVHKKYAGGERNLCVSKYNVGDVGPSGSGPSIPSSYSNYTLNTGQKCTYPGYCCWKGSTAATCGIGGNAGANYSGCNRTVCQWQAANESCLSWTAGGKTQAGAWRLPTLAELAAMGNYQNIVNNDRGKDGLQLCTEDTVNGYVRCYFNKNCTGASEDYCLPARLWTSTQTSTGIYAKIQNNFTTVNESQLRTGSARCVYDGTVRTVEEVKDYDESGASDNEPKNQADCDKFVALFIHKKYSGNSRNICVSKYNVGDVGPSGAGPNIPDTYKQYLLSTGTNCPKAGYCCWKGTTAAACGIIGNAGTNYGGCSRTVCQWKIADAACKAYTANGKTPAGYWRLPNSYELASWGTHQDIVNNNRGINGLQLCTESIIGGFVQCMYNTGCTGASSNYCLPGRLWSETSVGSSTYSSIQNNFQTISEAYNRALSARCIYDGTNYSN